jgi:hypothetical protein
MSSLRWRCLLKEVAAGHELSDNRIQKALSDFNDREWKVEAAPRRVDFHAIHRELGLSLASIRVLDQLHYDKIDPRRAVQSGVNFYGQKTASPNKARARKLIAAKSRSVSTPSLPKREFSKSPQETIGCALRQARNEKTK